MGKLFTKDYLSLAVAFIALAVSVTTAFIQYYPRESLEGVVLNWEGNYQLKDDVEKKWAEIDFLIVNSGNKKAVAVKAVAQIPHPDSKEVLERADVTMSYTGIDELEGFPVVIPPQDVVYFRLKFPIGKDMPKTSRIEGKEYITYCLAFHVTNSHGEVFESEIRVFSLRKKGEEWETVNHRDEWKFNMFEFLPLARYRQLDE